MPEQKEQHMEPDKTPDAGEGRCAVPPQAACDAARASESGFALGEPALVCRWRLTKRRVPLLNRHIRALAARRIQGAPVGRGILSWAKQHVPEAAPSRILFFIII